MSVVFRPARRRPYAHSVGLVIVSGGLPRRERAARPLEEYHRGNTPSMNLAELFSKFTDERAAELWSERLRWPLGFRTCPRRKSDRVQFVHSFQPMPYRCGAGAK